MNAGEIRWRMSRAVLHLDRAVRDVQEILNDFIELRTMLDTPQNDLDKELYSMFKSKLTELETICKTKID